MLGAGICLEDRAWFRPFGFEDLYSTGNTGSLRGAVKGSINGAIIGSITGSINGALVYTKIIDGSTSGKQWKDRGIKSGRFHRPLFYLVIDYGIFTPS